MPKTERSHTVATGPLLTREGLAWSYGQYVPDVDDRKSAQVSPVLEATLAHAPPAIIISAEIDPVADDARRYAEALTTAGVLVTAREYAGMPHSFMLLAGVLEDGEHAVTAFANGLAELVNRAEPPTGPGAYRASPWKA